MSLNEKIRKDYFDAMKNKDTLKKGVYSMLISNINAKEKEKGSTIDDQEIIVIIQKELKQVKETLSFTPSDRADLIEQSDAKIVLLNSYLPKQLSEQELTAKIHQFASDNNLELIKKNQGLIIKGLMSELQGQTDGKSLNVALSKILK